MMRPAHAVVKYCVHIYNTHTLHYQQKTTPISAYMHDSCTHAHTTCWAHLVWCISNSNITWPILTQPAPQGAVLAASAAGCRQSLNHNTDTKTGEGWEQVRWDHQIPPLFCAASAASVVLAKMSRADAASKPSRRCSSPSGPPLAPGATTAGLRSTNSMYAAAMRCS